MYINQQSVVSNVILEGAKRPIESYETLLCLYIGVTSDLIKRIWQHKNKQVEGFTKKYNVDKLVYYEIYEDIQEAIKREKTMKNMVRIKKIALIKSRNPLFKDLYEEILSSR